MRSRATTPWRVCARVFGGKSFRRCGQSLTDGGCTNGQPVRSAIVSWRCANRLRMAMTYDALVIGGGPGGATAALLLARAGWNVMLAEKTAFPRSKVCGEFI